MKTDFDIKKGNKDGEEESSVIDELARESNGMSGADICLICKEAGLKAIVEELSMIANNNN
jgi:ATP-dependent 26S proteasome regulatory subunit